MIKPAIFLSCSVPDNNNPGFVVEGNPTRIRAAIMAFVSEFLGNHKIVWGGHPAITPMFWMAAKNADIDYQQWVHLYQSALFSRDFPEENLNFKNVTLVDPVGSDVDKSLSAMRQEMIKSEPFRGGFFIGGMKGIYEELSIFRSRHPQAPCFLFKSPGGAASTLKGSELQPVMQVLPGVNFYADFWKCKHRMVEPRV